MRNSMLALLPSSTACCSPFDSTDVFKSCVPVTSAVFGAPSTTLTCFFTIPAIAWDGEAVGVTAFPSVLLSPELPALSASVSSDAGSDAG